MAAVGLPLLGVLIALRNYSTFSLSGDVYRFDLGWMFQLPMSVLRGRELYTEVPSLYGPYWYAYSISVLRLFGESLGGLRWGLVWLSWAYGLAVYVFASRLGSRGWGLAALLVTYVSPMLTMGIPYSSEMVAPLLVLVAGAVVFATQADARPTRWFIVGVVVGVLLSVRWATGLLAVAGVGLTWGATAQAHLPVRGGRWVGIVLIPGAFLACVAGVLWPYSLSLQVVLGVPAFACALLVACEGMRNTDNAAHAWRAWLQTPLWWLGGMVAAMAPWVIVLGSTRGFGGAFYDAFARALTIYRVGDYEMEIFTGVGMGNPPWPSGPVLWALLGLGLAGAATVTLPRPRARAIHTALLVVCPLAFLIHGAIAGPYSASESIWNGRLWLFQLGFAGWAGYAAWRSPSASSAPPWLVPLGCIAGAALLHSIPGDTQHVPGAQGPLVILGAALGARWSALNGSPARVRALAAAPVVLVLLIALGLRVSTLGWVWRSQEWRALRKPLVWLNFPRGQVWDTEPSGQSLQAHVAYIHDTLPPGAPLFSFPDPLLPVLSAHDTDAPVTYFLPDGYVRPGVDGAVAAWLRERRPALVAVRRDPAAWFGNPARLEASFPLILQTIDTHYRGVKKIDTVYYYTPRSPLDPVDRPGGP